MKTIGKKRFSGEDSIEAKRGESSSFEDSKKVSSSIKNLQKSVINSLWEDLIKGGKSTISEQIFGGKSAGGDLKAGQEIVLKEQVKQENLKTKKHTEYAEEVKKIEIVAENRNQTALEQKVHEILIELKKLAKSSKELQNAVKEAEKQEMPVKAGRYHINFLEWILLTVRSARTKVEEGANWASMLSGRRNQKRYWNMFKKHGTTFGLSQERTTATQTG